MDNKPASRYVRSEEDLLDLMDELFEATADRWTAGAGRQWWNTFYQDRKRPIPFFADKPDENLVSYVERGWLQAGRALDLGCGPGRNTLYLASRGFDVDGIDLSENAIQWAQERAKTKPVTGRATFYQGDAFVDGAGITGPYDLIYDSGCLHHLPPHRRVSYRQLLRRTLAPGGMFGVACFASPAMGTDTPDDQLYLRGGLEGGLAFTSDDPLWIFDDLELVDTRLMRSQPADGPLFGVDFLLTALFRRPAA